MSGTAQCHLSSNAWERWLGFSSAIMIKLGTICIGSTFRHSAFAGEENNPSTPSMLQEYQGFQD